MPHISKRKVKTEIFNQILDFLFVSLAEIDHKDEMIKFLNSFLTKTERLMLAKRLAIAYLLKENVSEQKISEVLSVGRPTIDRMRLLLGSESEGFEIALKKLRKIQMIEGFKKMVIEIIGKGKLVHPQIHK